MDRTYTVVGGASRMLDCANYVQHEFQREGFDTQKLTVTDSVYGAMLVQIRNSTSKVGSFFKTVTGLSTCATLKLSCDSRDLKLEVVKGEWIDKGLVIAFGAFVAFGIVAITGSIGLWKQSKLLDDVFMKAVGFFTVQRT